MEGWAGEGAGFPKEHQRKPRWCPTGEPAALCPTSHPMPQLDSEFVMETVVASAAFGNRACTVAFISVLECLVPSVLS